MSDPTFELRLPLELEEGVVEEGVVPDAPALRLPADGVVPRLMVVIGSG